MDANTTTTIYQIRKNYRMVQAQADAAATVADTSRYALEASDAARKSRKLNIAASMIHAAMMEVESANASAWDRRHDHD